MIKFISFDMDGTLVDSEFTDWVWGYGVPTLYAEKHTLSFDDAKASVEREYHKVGDGAAEWYDIKYWLGFFQLETSWEVLLRQFADKIRVYPDVDHLLDRLRERSPLVLTSNAGREFIEVEMEATGLHHYFDHIFSATSDFREVKKTPRVYRRILETLRAEPEELVHVGDHYEFDYLVPRSLGIHAFYLDRSGREQGDFILRDLRDVEKRIASE
jgi:putative hydrolase of the HAD superfamily